MFNELSIIHKADSLDAAYTVLENLVKSCIKAKELGLGDLRLHEKQISNLYILPLHNNYNVYAWLKDNRINEDLRNRFKEIATSFPLIKDSELDQIELFKSSEFRKEFQGSIYEVWGLGAAAIMDTLSLSLTTHPEWNNSYVEINHYLVDNDLNEITKKVTVKHFSSPESLNIHLAWWKKYQINSLEEGAELWSKRKEFFPNLEFCEEVEVQIKNLGATKTIAQIINRLQVLDDYVKNWTEGNFSYTEANQKTNLRISPESSTTLNKYGVLRKFLVPGEGKKVFDLHIKTGDLRFHFYPDERTRKVYIGYIGKHLRIASQD